MKIDDLPALMCAKCGFDDSRGREPNSKCACQKNKNEKKQRLDNWWKVHIRIRRFTKKKPFHFQLLIHALTKYDYFHAPSNWDSRLPKWTYCDPHEFVMCRWTRWAIKNRRKEEIWSLIMTDLNRCI